MKELLKLESVIKVYGDVRAVNDITLALYPGEKTLVYGPRGSGKTTLLRLICGMEYPSAGRVAAPNPIGVVQEQDGLIPEYTLAENIALPLDLRGEEQAKEKAREMMERLGISYIAGAKPGKVSRIERRLAVLARALIAEPPLLLLDEYTAGFSKSETTRLWEALTQLTRDIPIAMLMFSTEKYAQAFSKRYFIQYGQITEETR